MVAICFVLSTDNSSLSLSLSLSFFPHQIEVVEGNLVCPESGRKFPIQNGIPNMLLREDEVWDERLLLQERTELVSNEYLTNAGGSVWKTCDQVCLSVKV